jgi:four helix bundle protein
VRVSTGGRHVRKSIVGDVAGGETIMLRIYDDGVRLVRLLQPLMDKIGRRNRSLRKQLESAGPSIALNIGEGCHRLGGHQTERFETAAGSARECRAALHVAIAAGYLTEDECSEALDVADKIAATLWRCVHGGSRR